MDGKIVGRYAVISLKRIQNEWRWTSQRVCVCFKSRSSIGFLLLLVFGPVALFRPSVCLFPADERQRDEREETPARPGN